MHSPACHSSYLVFWFLHVPLQKFFFFCSYLLFSCHSTCFFLLLPQPFFIHKFCSSCQTDLFVCDLHIVHTLYLINVFLSPFIVSVLRPVLSGVTVFLLSDSDLSTSVFTCARASFGHHRILHTATFCLLTSYFIPVIINSQIVSIFIIWPFYWNIRCTVIQLLILQGWNLFFKYNMRQLLGDTSYCTGTLFMFL